MTERERRSRDIKARKRAASEFAGVDAGVDERGPRPDRERPEPDDRATEQWIDEGSVREAAVAATARGASARREPRTPIDPELVIELTGAVGEQRAARLVERLARAQEALERDRLDEARGIVNPILKEAPGVGAVHELAGLVQYRLGRWKQAARELEAARVRRDSVELLPVLADCYRGMRDWTQVDRIWELLKQASPSHDVMAEGRIVVAGSLADRGDLKGAIALMDAVSKPPKRVRDHHLRQWYALADLYDRAGDTVSAIRWFRAVAVHDPDFVDVTDRLRALGR